MFFKRQGLREEKVISAIAAQGAVQLMRQFDGFSGIATLARQGRLGDGIGAQGVQGDKVSLQLRGYIILEHLHELDRLEP